MVLFMENHKIERISVLAKEFEMVFRKIHENYWYALRTAVLVVIKFFECEKCGQCCINSPPIFTEDEARKIADFLKKRIEELPLIPVLHFSRILYKTKRPCPFLSKDRKCSIYPVRGIQCRSFPFEWLMYSFVPVYCPGLSKAISKANSFIKRNLKKLQKASKELETDLQRLASDSLFKEKMQYLEYKPLVNKLFRLLNEK